MKTAKTLLYIILGTGAMLIFNENIKALWLNAIGVACFVALLTLYTKTQHTTE